MCKCENVKLDKIAKLIKAADNDAIRYGGLTLTEKAIRKLVKGVQNV